MKIIFLDSSSELNLQTLIMKMDRKTRRIIPSLENENKHLESLLAMPDTKWSIEIVVNYSKIRCFSPINYWSKAFSIFN